jgi:hypothetical protein
MQPPDAVSSDLAVLRAFLVILGYTAVLGGLTSWCF